MVLSSKVVTPVKTGVQCFCNPLKSLDSGFHRNDDSWAFLTFDEFVNYDLRLFVDNSRYHPLQPVFSRKSEGYQQGATPPRHCAQNCARYEQTGPNSSQLRPTFWKRGIMTSFRICLI
jgi:hypothetical protein